jgi:hypothetical protein
MTISEQWPPVNNLRYNSTTTSLKLYFCISVKWPLFQVPRLVVVHRFGCTFQIWTTHTFMRIKCIILTSLSLNSFFCICTKVEFYKTMQFTNIILTSFCKNASIVLFVLLENFLIHSILLSTSFYFIHRLYFQRNRNETLFFFKKFIIFFRLSTWIMSSMLCLLMWVEVNSFNHKNCLK